MTTVIKAQDRFDESVTASVLAKATARGRQRRHPGLHAMSVAYLPAYRSLLIGFSDQSAVLLPVKNYPELSALGVAELEAGDRPWRHGAVPGGAGSARLDRGAGVGQPAADGPGGDGDRRAQRQPAHRGQGAGVAGEWAQGRTAAQGRGGLMGLAVVLDDEGAAPGCAEPPTTTLNPVGMGKL